MFNERNNLVSHNNLPVQTYLFAHDLKDFVETDANTLEGKCKVFISKV